MTIFYFINWIVASETIQGGNYSREETIRGSTVFKGGNYSRKYGMLILIKFFYCLSRRTRSCSKKPNCFSAWVNFNKIEKTFSSICCVIKETWLIGVCVTCCLLSKTKVIMTSLCSTAAPDCRGSTSMPYQPKQRQILQTRVFNPTRSRCV